MKNRIGKFFEELKHQMVDGDMSSLPAMRKHLYSFLKVIWIVVKGIRKDKLNLRASALTFISLVSIVPFLAVSLSVAKGMGGGSLLMPKIQEFIATLPANAAEAIRRILDTVEQANFGTMGAVGSILAIYTSLKLMGNIEHAFNGIWGIQTHRPFARKFADYLSVIVTVPLFVLLSSSITTFLSSKNLVSWMEEKVGDVAGLYSTLMSFTGLASVILAFMLLFLLMPNTRVRIIPALAGGLFAGVTWKLMQYIYIEFQVGVSSINAVYGTLAAIPFFLVWLYLSWLIVLFGAEVAFAVQHRKTFELEDDSESISIISRKLIASVIVAEICRDFRKGCQEWNDSEFSDRFLISHRLVSDVLHHLTEAGVLHRVEGKQAFLPSRDPATLTLRDVEQAFDGEEDAASLKQMSDCPEYSRVIEAYRKLITENDENSDQVTFADISK